MKKPHGRRVRPSGRSQFKRRATLVHADKRTKRNRTRAAQKRAALEEE